jgi:nicotinamide riboside kinase
MADAQLIALVGAESTGKTTLSEALHAHLRRHTSLRVALVPEWLRLWCEREARTPAPHEQAGIAAQQTAMIEAAAREHDLVICDTTPLMTAIYSELLFQDRSLMDEALSFQRRCALTLLSATDLPWVADGLQRDGPHARAPVDAAIRRELRRAELPYAIVSGAGSQRLDAALKHLAPLLPSSPACAPT